MAESFGDRDQDLVRRVSLLLRLGVSASALLLLCGGLIYLIRHGTEPVPDRRVFVLEPATYAHPRAILDAALGGQGRAIIQLGLLLLIATPILRVAYSVLAFARRRDGVYVFMALFVLIILLVGIFLAPGHGRRP